jgi:phage terminase large subunit-like protein
LAAPRGYAKSTIVSFLYVIWSLCYGKEHFILLLSATAKQAQKLLSNVSTVLETNSLLRADFPEVFEPKKRLKLNGLRMKSSRLTML